MDRPEKYFYSIKFPDLSGFFWFKNGKGGEKLKFKKLAISIASSALMASMLTLPVSASNAVFNFESPTYTVGNINGQDGWSKTGPYDSAVAAVSSFPNASGFGFGDQALRISNAVTSGSFGDQTISPALSAPAGESLANNHFEASFDIGSTQATEQPGLFLSVSPDDGHGSRMSYVGFDDSNADGIHVIFYDATDPGPIGTVASFNGTDVATINRTSAHNIKFVMDFVPGPANDVVKLYIDGTLVHTGTTWEDYYRYDPEQAGNGNAVPTTSNLIFPVRGAAASTTLGNGYLIDKVNLSSAAVPSNKDQCKDSGWQNLTASNGNPFKNQGDCVSYVQSNGHAIGNKTK